LKAKISYNVNIEDIPTEAGIIFDVVIGKSESIMRQAETIESLLIDEETIPEAIILMKKMRETLEDTDQRINDVSLILEGYIHFLESEDGGEDEKEIQHGGSNLDS
tara:strand:- start:562 stop:879 length:318 start_codon:yes stop_codon:yes gene_type:complete